MVSIARKEILMQKVLYAVAITSLTLTSGCDSGPSKEEIEAAEKAEKIDVANKAALKELIDKSASTEEASEVRKLYDQAKKIGTIPPSVTSKLTSLLGLELQKAETREQVEEIIALAPPYSQIWLDAKEKLSTLLKNNHS